MLEDAVADRCWHLLYERFGAFHHFLYGENAEEVVAEVTPFRSRSSSTRCPSAGGRRPRAGDGCPRGADGRYRDLGRDPAGSLARA
jgi:hypothetical protein